MVYDRLAILMLELKVKPVETSSDKKYKELSKCLIRNYRFSVVRAIKAGL